jgi:O-acetyl-ADP-ribose deacetylase (regulator of RNase III)
VVVNLLTQEAAYNHGQKPGRATTAHVNHALKELHKLIESEQFSSVALPRLSTGVGGLEWDEVYPLIQQHLGGLTIPVYVYTTYHKGQKANEA